MQPDDEAQIRHLAATYTDAVNRRDGVAMGSVYATDGILELGPRRVEGREAIVAAFRQLVEKDREFVFQMTHSGIVAIDGARATARWWFSEIKKPTGQDYEYVLGVYQDEVVRLDEGWRFARRRADGLLVQTMTGAAIAPFAPPPFIAIGGPAPA